MSSRRGLARSSVALCGSERADEAQRRLSSRCAATQIDHYIPSVVKLRAQCTTNPRGNRAERQRDRGEDRRRRDTGTRGIRRLSRLCLGGFERLTGTDLGLGLTGPVLRRD